MTKQIKEQITTITVKLSTRKKLNMWKYNLDCNTVDELIEKILKIIPASELKEYQTK